MSYLDLGFDNLLEKQRVKPTELTNEEVDLFVDFIGAEKISTGKSSGRRLDIDYDEGKINLSKNKTKKIEIGEFVDGTFGLRVYNASGDIIVNQSA